MLLLAARPSLALIAESGRRPCACSVQEPRPQALCSLRMPERGSPARRRRALCACPARGALPAGGAELSVATVPFGKESGRWIQHPLQPCFLNLHMQRLTGRGGWAPWPSLWRLSCSRVMGVGRTGWELRGGERPQGPSPLCLCGPGHLCHPLSLIFPSCNRENGTCLLARMGLCKARLAQLSSSRPRVHHTHRLCSQGPGCVWG